MTNDSPVTIVYYVLGAQKYFDECLLCIHNIRDHEPTVPIVVYADRAWPEVERFGVEVRIRNWKPGWLSKIRAIGDMPEERILYLDTDTYLTGPLAPMLRFCENYGIAAAPDPIVDTRRFQEVNLPWPEETLVPELNCGVIYVSKSRLPSDFFERWIAIQIEAAAFSGNELEFLPDQLGLRRVLHDTRIAYGVLPSIFNFRACYPQTIGEPPLLIHCRTPRPQTVYKRLKDIKDLTVWFPFAATVSRGGLLHKSIYALFRYAERFLARRAP